MSILWEMDRGGKIRKTKVQGKACVPAEPGEKTGPVPEPVEDRLDRLFLASRAVWELLKEKTGLTEEDLLRKVEEIDLTDGRLDGKARPAATCGNCGKRISARQARCIYCGAAQPASGAFD